jgi:1-acyl-sn-glycerol-3-phosphate acyltransferase
MESAPVMATLNRWWRVAVVAFCFAAVGLGGLFYVVTLFPALRLAPGGRAGRTHRVRAVIRWSFRLVIRVLEWGGVMRVEQRNADLLAASRGKPVLVLANHPCYLDILVLLALIPDALCVVKSGVWWNPFYGGVVRAAGYLSNDDPELLVETCAAALRAGSPLIVFPEGTRTAPGAPLRFMRGAARIALASGAAIQPILLRCEPPAFTRAGHWYHQPSNGFRLMIEAKALIGASTLLADESVDGFKPRALTRALERFFTTELEGYERASA